MPGFFHNIERRLHNWNQSRVEKRGFVEEKLSERWADVAGISTSGISVSSETSLKFSAVWNAIRLLSEIPASLPKDVIQYNPDGSVERLIDNPIDRLLHYPNDFMTGFDFHELMNASLQLHGNAVAVLFRDRTGLAVRVIPVSWSSVQVWFNNGILTYQVNDTLFGIFGTFFSSDIIHYKLLASNGLVGRSPIRLAADNIGLALSAERYGGEFFRKGGNHKAVIETQQAFKSYQEYAGWKEKYEKEHQGSGSDHGVPILQPGMSYKQLTMSMEDAQFIATRQFQITDVARWFNVPPHLIGDLSRATFSNIEHQDLQFIKYTLRGVVKRQEEEWEFKLIAPADRRRIDIKFNIDGLARGDMAARATYITTMVNGGILTPNEGREIEAKGPVAGGETIRVPANITGKPNESNKSNMSNS